MCQDLGEARQTSRWTLQTAATTLALQATRSSSEALHEPFNSSFTVRQTSYLLVLIKCHITFCDFPLSNSKLLTLTLWSKNSLASYWKHIHRFEHKTFCYWVAGRDDGMRHVTVAYNETMEGRLCSRATSYRDAAHRREKLRLKINSERYLL